MGAVINAKPNTNLMAVSILNSLSANAPGSTSTLIAEVTIGQAISTSLSTFMFVVQYPFSFSIGSIPSATQSSSYATNPIALYSSPSIYSYQIVSPNIFMLIFNEKFIVGRKFIVQVFLCKYRLHKSITRSLSLRPIFRFTVWIITLWLLCRPLKCFILSQLSATHWLSLLDCHTICRSSEQCSIINTQAII